jgi:hypothetical protein
MRLTRCLTCGTVPRCNTWRCAAAVPGPRPLPGFPWYAQNILYSLLVWIAWFKIFDYLAVFERLYRLTIIIEMVGVQGSNTRCCVWCEVWCADDGSSRALGCGIRARRRGIHYSDVSVSCIEALSAAVWLTPHVCAPQTWDSASSTPCPTHCSLATWRASSVRVCDRRGQGNCARFVPCAGVFTQTYIFLDHTKTQRILGEPRGPARCVGWTRIGRQLLRPNVPRRGRHVARGNAERSVLCATRPPAHSHTSEPHCRAVDFRLR